MQKDRRVAQDEGAARLRGMLKVRGGVQVAEGSRRWDAVSCACTAEEEEEHGPHGEGVAALCGRLSSSHGRKGRAALCGPLTSVHGRKEGGRRGVMHKQGIRGRWWCCLQPRGMDTGKGRGSALCMYGHACLDTRKGRRGALCMYGHECVEKGRTEAKLALHCLCPLGGTLGVVHWVWYAGCGWPPGWSSPRGLCRIL
eukprot:354548-Chlamydomonas_euryale.AAC.3